MELSEGVEINIIAILNGQNLIIFNGNCKNGYTVSRNIGESLADKVRDIGYKEGDKVPCRIYIEKKKS